MNYIYLDDVYEVRINGTNQVCKADQDMLEQMVKNDTITDYRLLKVLDLRIKEN